MQTWNEHVARAWVDDSWVPRAWIAATGHRWFGPRELPDTYRRFSYVVAECFQNSIEATRRDPSLRVAGGYMFREDMPTGIRHFWCLDVMGEVVDLALQEFALPAGYLGGAVELEHLEFLAAHNGLVLPDHLRAALAAKRKGKGKRRSLAAAAA